MRISYSKNHGVARRSKMRTFRASRYSDAKLLEVSCSVARLPLPLFGLRSLDRFHDRWRALTLRVRNRRPCRQRFLKSFNTIKKLSVPVKFGLLLEATQSFNDQFQTLLERQRLHPLPSCENRLAIRLQIPTNFPLSDEKIQGATRGAYAGNTRRRTSRRFCHQ